MGRRKNRNAVITFCREVTIKVQRKRDREIEGDWDTAVITEDAIVVGDQIRYNNALEHPPWGALMKLELYKVWSMLAKTCRKASTTGGNQRMAE